MNSANFAAGPDEGPRPPDAQPSAPPRADGVPPQRAGDAPPRPDAAAPSDFIPVQALAQGGTLVRPGALVWGSAPGGPGAAPDAAAEAADGETLEKVLVSLAGNDGYTCDLLFHELARARVWIPLPDRRRPFTDGSAVDLPVVTYLGADFVPCFTSPGRLARYAGKRSRRPADTRRIPHIVVPAAALARLLPPGLGMALNPGAEASVPLYPPAVACLAGKRPDDGAGEGDGGIRVGHPPAEPAALLREVARELERLPGVRDASRAWLTVTGAGEGLIVSVSLDDPSSADARDAAVRAVEHAAASLPGPLPHPLDVTFPGEDAPDLIDEWVAAHAAPFYTRGGA
ncbi:MAG: enhanced serine sensitivity protein SseB [Streptosporangiales bacterium]|nr:enhanced serine sensitivity protein SseB [Streptosporangiales bacterium]